MSPPSIYVDTTVFMELLSGTPDKADALVPWFSWFRSRPRQAVTSEFTLAEVMGQETANVGWAQQGRFYLNLIVWSGFIDLRPVSRDILFETGVFRRAARLDGRSGKLPDAIHVVTAIKAGCPYVLSSDKRLALPDPLRRIDPFAYDAQGVERLLDA